MAFEAKSEVFRSQSGVGPASGNTVYPLSIFSWSLIMPTRPGPSSFCLVVTNANQLICVTILATSFRYQRRSFVTANAMHM